ncbi:MAG: 5-formyltetrahydrofolate cyclo-ligase [Anaerolineae bacterium]|nr:5-formyltetrahydrofolate cyclo-ligase [Anaerolineae bacterium]
MDKAEIRQWIWDLLEKEGVVRFPGAQGRIPNFDGAEEAARRLAGLPIWRAARAIKCNPDSPQKPVRLRALREGKVVYMAVPRLRDARPFIELDPARLRRKLGDDLGRAATIRGAFRYGRPVRLEKMLPVDLVVAGSVAVTRDGARLGKGGGYSDLEFALARQAGLIGETTPVVTTVHALQVIERPIPMTRHDVALDYIATPQEVIATGQRFGQPAGIYWDELPPEKLAAIPVLRQQRQTNGRS